MRTRGELRDLLERDEAAGLIREGIKPVLIPRVCLSGRQRRSLIADAVESDQQVDVVVSPHHLNADTCATGELETDLHH